jgi:RHS repeat-associated protein
LQTYNYDGNGNRSVSATPGFNLTWPTGFNPSQFLPTTANNANYGVNNQLTLATATNYDPAGNQKVLGGYTSTFDAEGRMTSNTISNGTVGYIYDGEGQRLAKLTCPSASPCGITTSGATVQTIYVYDASGNLAGEYSSTTATLPCTTCYVTLDYLGSTRLLTNESGNAVRHYDYLPFGEEIPPDGTVRTTQLGYQSVPDGLNPKFTGQTRDTESGLDFFNARYYSPAQGRFVSPDPNSAGFDADDPQTWKGYTYVTNNPLVYADPSGLQQVSVSGSQGSESPYSPWDWQTYGPNAPFYGPFGPNPLLLYSAGPTPFTMLLWM